MGAFSHAPILPSLVAISIELVAIFSKAYAISCFHTKFQHVDTVTCQGLHEAHLVLVTRVYTTTDGRHAINFYQSIQKHRTEKRQSLGRLKRLYSEPSAQLTILPSLTAAGLVKVEKLLRDLTSVL